MSTSISNSANNGPLRWKRVAFTGRLGSLSRRDAWAAVLRGGGYPCVRVTQRTSVLVVGMEGWPSRRDDLGRDVARAEELIRRGRPIQIISEHEFLEISGLRRRTPVVAKTLSAMDVCAVLGMPAERLRCWQLLGLVTGEGGFFDYQDLVGLRAVSELVQQGVSVSTIGRSLCRLARILPHADRAICRWRFIPEKEDVLIADLGCGRLGMDGQFVLDFERQADADATTVAWPAECQTAEAWFERGVLCEQDGRIDSAIEAYREAIRLKPEFAEACFNLGNVLRAAGDTRGAEEMFQSATKLDRGMAAAWYNLGDVCESQERIEEAIAAYRSAIAAHPSYADAHFNLALCLERSGLRAAARRHWSAYLALDPKGESAQIAVEHLRQDHQRSSTS